MRNIATHRTNRGLTLIEILVALAVSGVLMAVGMSQWAGVLGAKAADHSVSSLAVALRLAKSEAMKRGEPVSVCARDPQAGDQGQLCTTSGKDWSAGWIVFVDRGVRGQVDADDLVIQVHQPAKANVTIQATLRYISLQPTGVSLTAASHFDFLPGGRADTYGARRVCINKPGRMRQLAGVSDCVA